MKHSTPSLITIIRHGEKPNGDERGLSAQGHARAQSIAQNTPVGIVASDFIFAAKKSKASVRPIQTILPYAKAVKQKLNTDFEDADYKGLVKALLTKKKYRGQKILICWHHGFIPQLIEALGLQTSTLLPMTKDGKWDENVFDRIISIAYHINVGGDTLITTTSLPQRLLFGDSAE
jgi:hypothetical protein